MQLNDRKEHNNRERDLQQVAAKKRKWSVIELLLAAGSFSFGAFCMYLSISSESVKGGLFSALFISRGIYRFCIGINKYNLNEEKLKRRKEAKNKFYENMEQFLRYEVPILFAHHFPRKTSHNGFDRILEVWEKKINK